MPVFAAALYEISLIFCSTLRTVRNRDCDSTGAELTRFSMFAFLTIFSLSCFLNLRLIGQKSDPEEWPSPCVEHFARHVSSTLL